MKRTGLSSRHLLLLAGSSVLICGYLGHHYYGKIRHLLFGEPVVYKTTDLYNATDHVFKRGRRDLNEVCLTIDDGPHPSLHRILPILKRYGVKATFFMVGIRLAASPKLVREVLAEGHEIGNHTENHERMNDLPDDRIRAEIDSCEQAFEKATGGQKMKLFRPPGMDVSSRVCQIAADLGYTTVWSTCGAKDFILKTGGPNVTLGKGHIAQNILKQVKPGSIIVLHDTDDTADALPEILDGLKAKGLAVKTASEMIAQLPQSVFAVKPSSAQSR